MADHPESTSFPPPSCPRNQDHLSSTRTKFVVEATDALTFSDQLLLREPITMGGQLASICISIAHTSHTTGSVSALHTPQGARKVLG